MVLNYYTTHTIILLLLLYYDRGINLTFVGSLLQIYFVMNIEYNCNVKDKSTNYYYITTILLSLRLSPISKNHLFFLISG